MSVPLTPSATVFQGCRGRRWGMALWNCQPPAGLLMTQAGSRPDIAGAFSTSPPGPKIEP
jgi:hypothetical protein